MNTYDYDIRSMEDKNKMVKKKKEQLQEEVVPEVPEESVAEDNEVVEAQEAAPEVVEPAEEESSPAEKSEASEEKIEEVEDLDVETEKLSLQIEKTKEELAVIGEVREELVKLYADFKEVEQLKDSLEKEKEALKSDNEVLSEQLTAYKVAEEKFIAERYLRRLEQLSAKFRALGQEKTVEYLSAKDETTIREFENIVDAALSKVGETAEMPSVTSQTQTESLSETQKPAPAKEEVKVEAKEEKLSDKNFFANVCGQLTNEQVGAGKKTKFM